MQFVYTKIHSYCVQFDGFLTAPYTHIATEQNTGHFNQSRKPFPVCFLPVHPLSCKPSCFLIVIRFAVHVSGLCGDGVSHMVSVLSSFSQPSVTEISSTLLPVSSSSVLLSSSLLCEQSLLIIGTIVVILHSHIQY